MFPPSRFFSGGGGGMGTATRRLRFPASESSLGIKILERSLSSYIIAVLERCSLNLAQEMYITTETK